MSNFELNLQGKALSYATTQVMGIVNVTPDSFWEGSRMSLDAELIRARVHQILDEGGSMIDVGAYSTRPGAPDVSPQEELDRLAFALALIREEVGCDVPISVDSFRADVADVCIRELGANIINDISGGMLDERMLQVVATTGAPYILMHMRGTPQTMQQLTDYPDGVTHDVIRFFSQQLAKLEKLRKESSADLAQQVQQKNTTTQQQHSKRTNQQNNSGTLILDPGFGFAKTLEQNYELLHDLPRLLEAFPDYPMLVGISRKSMIYRLLGSEPAHALNGTTVLNTFATQCGAHILRVHDVREAVETVKIVNSILR